MKKTRVYCIPHAGGSAMVYNKWNEFAGEHIEIVPVELAGRGNRIREQLYETLDEAVDDVYRSIENKLDDSPYVIYGHSMGSWIALELCFKIIQQKKSSPIMLIISGKEPPIKERCGKVIHRLNEDDFKEEMLKLGGTPEEVFDDEDLKNLFIPIIRSDYKIIETYDTKKILKKLPYPIILFNGIDDDVTTDEVEGWRNYTSKKFEFFNFKGGHFFVYENAKEVVDKINNLMLVGGVHND